MGITNRFATEEYVEIGLNEKITIPLQAAVGQVVSVKEVDGSGIPTEWECVNLPTDEYINALIDAKLGVIENGYY